MMPNKIQANNLDLALRHWDEIKRLDAIVTRLHGDCQIGVTLFYAATSDFYISPPDVPASVRSYLIAETIKQIEASVTELEALGVDVRDGLATIRGKR